MAQSRLAAGDWPGDRCDHCLNPAHCQRVSEYLVSPDYVLAPVVAGVLVFVRYGSARPTSRNGLDYPATSVCHDLRLHGSYHTDGFLSDGWHYRYHPTGENLA